MYLCCDSVKSRIRCVDLLKKIKKPDDCIQYFRDGQSIGWSGFSPVGYPKVVPIALAEYVEKNCLQGKLRFDLFVGASVGVETEDRWAQNGMIRRRWPYATGKALRKGINSGEIQMGDKHLSMFAQDLK